MTSSLPYVVDRENSTTAVDAGGRVLSLSIIALRLWTPMVELFPLPLNIILIVQVDFSAAFGWYREVS